MMPELPQIYNSDFFYEWGISNDKYIESANTIANILFTQFQPRSTADLGCGCGVYSYFFQQKKVDILSIDGVEPPAKDCCPVKIIVRDLTIPFENHWGKFDITLCLEVAEHIPEKFVDSFLANITHFSDTLILSAATPFQGGHYHVNEQPKRYWKQKLQEVNFLYNRKKTGQFLEKFKKNKVPHMWMGENISIYERI